MALNKEQEELYRKTMEEAKRQLEEIDANMGSEIQKIREKLVQLQESKKSYKQIYKGAAQLLGIEVEDEEEEDSSGNSSSPMQNLP